MTAEPTIVATAALRPTALFNARRDAIQQPRYAARAGGRHAQMALLVGATWVLAAIAMLAAGEGTLALCFAVVAALWISIATLESQDRRTPSATRTLGGQIRWQAAQSGI